MNTLEFFNLVLPATGYRCIAKVNHPGFAHHILSTNHEAAKRVHWLDYTKNEEVYFACGSLENEFIVREVNGHEKKVRRVRENIKALRSFWLDIDCGEGKPYATQQDGFNALATFLQTTGLSYPIIVNSGFGLHCYFPLNADLDRDTWEQVANHLHVLTMQLGLQVDTSRTRDPSSVLRPVGSRNKKRPDDMRQVEQLNYQYQVTDIKTFLSTLILNLRKLGITKLDVYTRPKQVVSHGINDDLLGGIYEPTINSAYLVASKCAAIAMVRDTKGNVSEPLWYSAISVLRNTVESPDVIHQWSEGHPDYSFQATESKISQSENTGTGPSTCQYIKDHTEAANVCAACPHLGLITSPIQLGKMVEEKEAPPIEMDLEDAFESDDFEARDIGRFELTKHGVFFKDSYEPGSKIEPEMKARISAFPIILKSNMDHAEHGGIVEVQYDHPVRGVQSFLLEKTKLADRRTFTAHMAKNHLVMHDEEAKLMKQYFTEYLNELDNKVQMTEAYDSLGWKDDMSTFVYGPILLRKNASPIQTNNPHLMKETYAKGIRFSGTEEAWSQLTLELKLPGMEMHALSLLWGFAAPLQIFTGYAGTLINMTGRSGTGKSTMQEWICSIYGDFKSLKAQKEDTYNSMMSRFGCLNNIPIVIEELTNMENRNVSDLVYSISQGKEKSRLNRNSKTMEAKYWSTLVIGSSNSSMGDKLKVLKSVPEAELLRLIEYTLDAAPNFERNAEHIHEIIETNTGKIGAKYIQYVINNQDSVKKLIEKSRKSFSELVSAKNNERFWINSFALAIAGGEIAKQLKLIRFSVQNLVPHMAHIVNELRVRFAQQTQEYALVLSRFLNDHSDHILLCIKDANGIVSGLFEPRRDLRVRAEQMADGTHYYIDSSHLRKWLDSQGISLVEFYTELKSQNIAIDRNRKKVLGEDWHEIPSQGAVDTYHFVFANKNSRIQEVPRATVAPFQR